MQLVWFAQKGELDDDSVAVLRKPVNLRTIFGSNADAKLIFAGVSDSIVDATLELTPAAQRGFCRGRQLSLNVVDSDTYSKAFNICADRDLTKEHRDLPLGVLFLISRRSCYMIFVMSFPLCCMSGCGWN